MEDVHATIWGPIGGHACLHMGDVHVSTWGTRMSLYGGHACRYMGDMHDTIWGTCMLLYGGHACHYMGDMHVIKWGTCMSLYGGHAGHDVSLWRMCGSRCLTRVCVWGVGWGGGGWGDVQVTSYTEAHGVVAGQQARLHSQMDPHPRQARMRSMLI
jgi:hypothetical protein